MSDTSNYVAGLVGEALAMNLTDPAGTVKNSMRRTYSENYSDAATAGTAVTETVHANVQRAGKVVAAKLSAPIAVTANDTNYATVTVSKRTGAGGAVVIASRTTQITGGSGNIVAFVPVTLTLTAANQLLAAGDVLTVAVTKTGSGVALTAATSNINVTVDVEESV